MVKKSITLADLPVPTFIEANKKLKVKQKNRAKLKHADAFDAYARWVAKPKKLRNPSTKQAFIKLWKLPPNYIYNWEDQEEFQALKYKYFWNWMFDMLPDIAYAAYQRAIDRTRGSAQDAKLLMELIGKKIDADRPQKTRIQPFFLVGVPQNKIEELFTPQEYINAAEKTIEFARERHAHTSMDKPPKELNIESI
jgi:hypothetical protein